MKLKKKLFYPNNFLFELDKKKRINSSLNIEQPMVSVVMPSFNHSKYIERSILSVINQDYYNIQLIIIDGGSKDETVNIIKKYAAFIDYWVSEKDKGQSDALNKGFKVCKGEILCWLNSDDLFLPGTLTNAVETLTKIQKKICVLVTGLL